MDYIDAQLGPGFARDASTLNLALALQHGRELAETASAEAQSLTYEGVHAKKEQGQLDGISKTLIGIALLVATVLFAYVAWVLTFSHL